MDYGSSWLIARVHPGGAAARARLSLTAGRRFIIFADLRRLNRD
jgi:hypothetical protein